MSGIVHALNILKTYTYASNSSVTESNEGIEAGLIHKYFKMILQEPSVTCMVPQLQISASRVGGLSSESKVLNSTIRTQFWIELFSDLRERHLFNGSHEHKCLLRYVFLGILQKDLDEYRQLWNNHTIRPVRLSQCPSGKPDAMYHLPHRFGGRECGFPVSWEALHHFDGIMQASSQYNLCGDENLEMHFVDLQRRSGLAPPVNWTAAVQNYISMKNMSGV
ncbi:uncharacterized protein LOC117544015 isoform X7 [Gymnodraco acuticeps]|uniref:Uncharacterized protein LOC117544015 isoform X7 n=1 Tax=Gymnodraco acuticeps TaxID=8218 RepID=A0A6P8TWK3_GYMAC|nr:uncharacterized protein LOC117544015 isoform X7 [Gymnodraco acuticeps]